MRTKVKKLTLDERKRVLLRQTQSRLQGATRIEELVKPGGGAKVVKKPTMPAMPWDDPT